SVPLTSGRDAALVIGSGRAGHSCDDGPAEQDAHLDVEKAQRRAQQCLVEARRQGRLPRSPEWTRHGGCGDADLRLAVDTMSSDPSTAGATTRRAHFRSVSGAARVEDNGRRDFARGSVLARHNERAKAVL